MSNESKLAELRVEYAGTPLTKDRVARDPIEQFGRWFDEVMALGVPLANAMTLATADVRGQPSARIVLLKDYDERGFVFYTSYASRKARELSNNPRAALLFWWQPLDRQVRIEGALARVSAAESDAYWASRPRASNLSAMASPQSQAVDDRAWLEERVSALHGAWDGRALVRPDDWGGYRLTPERIELWQGREDRLHDRLCYLRHDGGWRLERLAP